MNCATPLRSHHEVLDYHESGSVRRGPRQPFLSTHSIQYLFDIGSRKLSLALFLLRGSDMPLGFHHEVLDYNESGSVRLGLRRSFFC